MFGLKEFSEPEPVAVDLGRLVSEYKTGFRQFKSFYKDIFCPDCYETLKKCSKMAKTKFVMPMRTWVMVLYETAATFHEWKYNRTQLINLVTPLYLGRVASFINQSLKMSATEAEGLVEEQAQVFEAHKDYLIEVWDKGVR